MVSFRENIMVKIQRWSSGRACPPLAAGPVFNVLPRHTNDLISVIFDNLFRSLQLINEYVQFKKVIIYIKTKLLLRV